MENTLYGRSGGLFNHCPRDVFVSRSVGGSGRIRSRGAADGLKYIHPMWGLNSGHTTVGGHADTEGAFPRINFDNKKNFCYLLEGGGKSCFCISSFNEWNVGWTCNSVVRVLSLIIIMHYEYTFQSGMVIENRYAYAFIPATPGLPFVTLTEGVDVGFIHHWVSQWFFLKALD